MLYHAPATHGPPQHLTPQLRDLDRLAAIEACQRYHAAVWPGARSLRLRAPKRDAFYAALKARCGR